MNKKKMYILSIVGLLVLIYLIITLILYNSQRSLLYHPSENNYSGDMITVISLTRRSAIAVRSLDSTQ